MKRCVAYCRVSTNHEEQKTSIETQKKHYSNLFSSDDFNPASCGMLYKKDGTILPMKGIFVDEGISGTSLKNRQAFNEMIKLAHEGAFDIIYTPSVSRFSRNVEDGVRIVKDLKEIGVAVYFEEVHLNTLDPVGELAVNMLFSIAEADSKNKSISVKRGIRAMQREGRWNAKEPYGYDIVNGYLVINEEEAEVVKKIFNLFTYEGLGSTKIVQVLEEDGIKTKTEANWHSKTILNMLDNDLYIGVQTVHTKESDEITRHTEKIIQKKDQIIHIKPELMIISEEVFEDTKLLRLKRRNNYSVGKRYSNKHLLSSLVKCGHCGTSFTRQLEHTRPKKDGTVPKEIRKWQCRKAKTNLKYCSHRNSFREEDLEARIKQKILELKETNLDDIMKLYLDTYFDYDRTNEHINRLSKQLAKLDNELMNLLSLVAKGKVKEEYYEMYSLEIEKKKKIKEDELERIENHNIRVKIAKRKYEEFKKELRRIDVNNLTNKTVKRIFSSITVTDYESFGRVGRVKVLKYNYNFLDVTLDELQNEAENKKLRVKELMQSNQIIYLDVRKRKKA